MRRAVFAFALVFAATPSLIAQAVEGPLPELEGKQMTQRSRILNNDAIIRMTKAGLDDSIIMQTIRSQTGDFHTAPDDLVALKDAGVSQRVISFMMARNSMMQLRSTRPIEVSPLSPINDDPGVYYKNKQEQWELVSPELVRYRDGGALKSVLTNNIVKKDENGVVSKPKSELKLSPGTEILILASNPMVDAVEYTIIRFHEKSDRREFRIRTGNVFHSETGTDKDALEIRIKKVSSRLFSFTIPADLTKGEYGVLVPGSAGIGHGGKIYTFSINE